MPKLKNLKNGQQYMKVFEHLPEDKDDISTPWTDTVQEDFHVVVYRDKYPVTEGHLLFVPKYSTTHILSEAFNDAFRYGREKVQKGEWDGFNIGLNYGESAGQTVPWPHIHLIPRRKGDVEDPVGGVRNTIPGKGNYRSLSYKQD
jgi:diadenosine tetraphosphate (Ap4A) HIT family hydrolase